jgi:Flp pilus assembly protein TadD
MTTGAGSSEGLSLWAGGESNDDVAVAKRHFRENNYGLAERHFRRAVEAKPDDAEAWVGLGAAYDQLKRFELADRAYEQAARLIGPSPEILNNQGYSLMLRGEYEKARAKLLEAQALDPDNPYVQSNLALLQST